jgi:putative oxidoreductase
MLNQRLERLAFLPPLLARLALGVVFVQSGWGKLHSLGRVTTYFTELGIPFASIQAPFVATIELVCGALLLVGLGTRLAALPLAGTMVVAIVTAQRAAIGGLGDLLGLLELSYLVLLVWLVIAGGGRASLDRLLVSRRSQRSSSAPRPAPAGA